MPDFTKTLFICTGNIYRSIISEKLFEQNVRKNRLPFQARSRGTDPHFKTPNPLLNRIVEREYSITLNSYRAQRLALEDISWASAIVCFTSEHVDSVEEILSGAKNKTFLINEISSLDPHLFKDIDYYDVSENNHSLLTSLRALKKAVDIMTHPVTLSVVMAVYNEEKNIGNILTKLVAQASHHFVKEIIVVSSGCTDKTNEIIQSIRSPLIVAVEESTRNGKVSALKKATSFVYGDIVLLIDGDVDIGDNFIHECFSCIYNKKIPCAGRVVPMQTPNKFFYGLAKASCDAWNNLRYKQDKAGEFLYPSGYSLLIPRQNFVDGINGISDTAINDDGQLALILSRKGIVFHYADKLKVYVTFPQSFSDFFKQKIRTRMGRRQTSVSFFKDLEKRWRRELIKSTNIQNFPFVITPLIMDGIARCVANIKIKFSRKPHLWAPVETTKEVGFSTATVIPIEKTKV